RRDQVRQQDDALEAAALRILKDKHPSLLLVYFGETEFANRGYGVASPEGQQAAQDVDARLGRLAQALDLSQSTLVVTSDHGHIDRGGYGGAEDAVLNVPLVAAGRAIVPGRYDPASQTELAPTIAP